MPTVNEGSILLTGANGWLGTEYLENELAEHGSSVLQRRVVCIGSREGTKTLSDGTVLPIHKFETVPKQKSVLGIIHLAFLTRDKVATKGLPEYTFQNTAITSAVLNLIKTTQPKWVGTVSSGAINAQSGSGLETDLSGNPYGYLKRVEEELLDCVCSDVGANLSIGRLWGASGSFMPINRAYALSDFIVQAMETGSIEIRSNHPVFRRYSKANEFLKILELTAAQKQRTLFDSGGPKIEMFELAGVVAQKTHSTVKPRSLSEGEKPDVYFPISGQYESLASEYGIALSNIEEQVESAIISHKR